MVRWLRAICQTVGDMPDKNTKLFPGVLKGLSYDFETGATSPKRLEESVWNICDNREFSHMKITSFVVFARYHQEFF